MRLNCLENAYSCPLIRRAILTRKVGLTDLIVFAMRSGFISRSLHQDYKSLCAAVMICSTLVNIQTDTHADTHRQHFDQIIWTAQPPKLKAHTWWSRAHAVASRRIFIQLGSLEPLAASRRHCPAFFHLSVRLIDHYWQCST